MSDGPSPAAIPGVALALALTAAVSMAVAITLRDEAASDRTQLLVAIAAMGAFLAGLVATFFAFFTRRWPGWLRGPFFGAIAAALFVPATLFCFAVQIRIIDGHIDAESVAQMPVVDLFWSLFGAMGMFTPTGLRYLVPWPVLAVGLVAALIFLRWPSRSSH
ncbi:MAG: hypothetical protein ACRC7G_13590 [Beijerinckiaceae bacterium]